MSTHFESDNPIGGTELSTPIESHLHQDVLPALSGPPERTVHVPPSTPESNFGLPPHRDLNWDLVDPAVRLGVFDSFNGRPVNTELWPAISAALYNCGTPLPVNALLQQWGMSPGTACDTSARILSSLGRSSFCTAMETLAAYNLLPADMRQYLTGGTAGTFSPIEFISSIAGRQSAATPQQDSRQTESTALAAFLTSSNGRIALDTLLQSLRTADNPDQQAMAARADRAIAETRLRNAGLGRPADDLFVQAQDNPPAQTQRQELRSDLEDIRRLETSGARIAVDRAAPSTVSISLNVPGRAFRQHGSGFIVDRRGIVVTAGHVVENANNIVVTLENGTQVPARVIERNRDIDMAVLELTPPANANLQEMAIGPSSGLRRGDAAVAIGSPFAYRGSVTSGIVSALNRELTMPDGTLLRNIIQTDAAINPGNSGGVLVNINGELIGMNVAMRDGAQTMGFAVTSDALQQALSSSLSAERRAGITHGLRGREIVDPRTSIRQRFQITEVPPASPAHAAGLRNGDIIVSIGGRTVRNRFDVERAFWGRQAGAPVELSVLRNGGPVIAADGNPELTEERLPRQRAGTQLTITLTPQRAPVRP